MTFGERVAIVRKLKKMTQAELGTLVGYTGDIVSKYERGVPTPSIDIAAKFAKALNTSLDYLVNGITSPGNELTGELPAQLQQFNQLQPEDQAHLLAVMDAFLTKAKLQSLLG
ncbi:helix-turn-helix transcriptional regulator [Chitinophaga agrisoli]|uniref:Helix-turn-helix transcriptional regulator n=1 Tax=Chitinophaga agrisoli TaxID=2607653 RepID=A0A5B2VNF9_9BACT|nr:helix-turn-helix transcriptional regulator [Chitinophaga agrisoli]KAA2240314.1 helix-turn-helix transcriptional regulator [Chitinophaga agrisoli]